MSIYRRMLDREPIEISHIASAMKEYQPFISWSNVTKARFYVYLALARGRYASRKHLERTPNLNVVSKEIKKIINPLRKIADFGVNAIPMKMSEDLGCAATLVELQAVDWAEKQSLDDLPHSFRPPASADKVPAYIHGAVHFFYQFFEDARRMQMFAERAEALSRGKKYLKEHECSAIEWLIGLELPRIYEKVCRREFTAWVAETGNSDGFDFIAAALEAMRMRTPKGARFSLNTIRAHYRAASKRANSAAKNGQL